MATTITPVQRIPLAAGVAMTVGTYATDGSTAATLSVAGGNIVSVEFYDNNGNALSSAGTASTVTLSAKTTTGNVTNITVTPGGSAVTAGTFEVKHGGI